MKDVMMLGVLIICITLVWSASRIKITINHPAVACACPPPPTQAELDKQDADIRCQQFKRNFINYFGGLPYDPCIK